MPLPPTLGLRSGWWSVSEQKNTHWVQMLSQQSSPQNSFFRLHRQSRFRLFPRQRRAFERSSTPMIAHPFCRKSNHQPFDRSKFFHSPSCSIATRSSSGNSCCLAVLRTLYRHVQRPRRRFSSSGRRSTKSGSKKPCYAGVWARSITDVPNWSPSGSAFVERLLPDTQSIFTRPCHWLKCWLGTHVVAQARCS